MPMPTPYDSWCGGYDIINGRDARSNFEFMWGRFIELNPLATDPFGLQIDADLGFVGDFIQLQINGVDIAYIDFNGNYIGTMANLIFAAAGYIALVPTTNIYLGDGGITNYVQIDNAGFMSFAGAATLEITNLAADPVGLGAGEAGTVWYNTADSQFKGWTGLAVVILG